jgi:lipoprotein-anchoring transpeptidase ErfK/SrfK
MNKRSLVIGAACLALALVSILAYTKIRKTTPQPSSQAKNSDYESAGSLSARAKELEAKGDLLEAKNIYQKLANDFPNANLNEIAGWQKKTEDINIKLLFSPALTPNAALYEIKSGDTLVKISREFKTTPELIMKSNNLAGDKIIPGRKIKVWTAPFSILVDKSQNTLLLKANEEVIKSYTVSTGKNNCTPVGVFKIVNKLPNPTWFKAGAVVPADSPENILGSRWMGFDLPGYGIHGTTDPKSLGTQATQGCVRMSNAEVEELYAIVPAGTEVTIVD